MSAAFAGEKTRTHTTELGRRRPEKNKDSKTESGNNSTEPIVFDTGKNSGANKLGTVTTGSMNKCQSANVENATDS